MRPANRLRGRQKSEQQPPKPPFQKKPVVAETPIRGLKNSGVSVDSGLSVSNSNKSLSQAGSRIKELLTVLPKDLDPATLNLLELKQENEQLKLMKLSEDAIENLKKFQRFDRFIYPIESDKILKKPIELELKRLEKLKNLREDMRGKIYDTELLITVLYNHTKLVFEMNRELEEREVLRKQKNEAMTKMHQIKQESIRQVRELKEQLRMGLKNTTPIKIQPTKQPATQVKEFSASKGTPAKPTPLKKQQLTTLNMITATLKGNKLPEALEEIQKFIQKYSNEHPEMCKVFSMMVPMLEKQIQVSAAHRELESRSVQTNNFIDKINRCLRANQFDDIEKLKNETLKQNSEHKNIGLLAESVLNVYKAKDADKKKRVGSEDNKAFERISQQLKELENQLKQAREELIRERTENAQNLKIKISLEKQIERMKKNQHDLNAKQAELSKNTPKKDEASKIKADLERNMEKLKKTEQDLQQKEQELIKERAKNTQNEQAKASLSQQLERLKKNELEFKSKEKQLAKERAQSLENSRVKTSLEKQVQKLKSLQVEAKQKEEQLRKQRAEKTQHIKAKAILQKQVQKLKQNEKDLKEREESLQKITSQNADLTKTKTALEKQVERLKKIETQSKSKQQELRKERAQNSENTRLRSSLQRELQKVKKNEIQLKSRAQQLQKSHLEESQRVKNEISQIYTCIDKITELAALPDSKLELEKAKKRLQSDSSTRKLVPIADTLLQLYTKYHSLESQNERFLQEKEEKEQRLMSQQKSHNQDMAVIRQQTSALTQAIKYALRSWNRGKPEALLKDNKLIQHLSKQLEKPNLEILGNVSAEIISMLETAVTIINNEHTRQSERLVNEKQMLANRFNDASSEIAALKESLKESNDVKKEYNKMKLEKQRLERIKQKTERQLEAVKTAQIDESQQKSKMQDQKLKKLQLQLSQSKNECTRLANEKEVLETRYQDSTEEVIRLKKLTQEYVQQEKKVLQALQEERREKEEQTINYEQMKRSVERLEKEKELFSKNLKHHDSEVIKLKQIELLHDTSVREYEMKVGSLQNNLNAREKQVRTLMERNAILLDEKDRAERNALETQKSLTKEKDENQRKLKMLKENLEYSEKLKTDLSRQVDRLTEQVRYELEEREADKKHYANIISKLEKSSVQKESRRQQEVNELHSKYLLVSRENEELKSSLEKEQILNKKKILELTNSLQVNSGSTEIEKMDMRKKLQRMSMEMTTLTNIHQSEKADFKKHISRLNSELQSLMSEKNQEKRIYRQEVERARNQQYQINYEKIKKQREQIRRLEEDLDRLNEIIEINEINYNKIVVDNKDMYDRILELQKVQAELRTETERLTEKCRRDEGQYQSKNSELNEYTNKLEKKIKQLEDIVNSGNIDISLANSKHQNVSRDLETKIDELNHQNIKMRVQLEQILQNNSKLEQENYHLRETNISIEKEFYAVKQNAQASESLIRNSSKQELEVMLGEKYQNDLRMLNQKISFLEQKNHELTQEKIKLEISCSNLERLTKDREMDVSKVSKTVQEFKEGLRDKNEEIKALLMDKNRLEASIVQIEKGFFVKELQLKQEINTLEARSRSMSNAQHEIESARKESARLDEELRKSKDNNLKLQRQIIQLTHEVEQKRKTIEYLEKEIEQKKGVLAHREIEYKEYVNSMNRSLQESINASTSQPSGYSGTITILERNIEDNKRQIQRLHGLIDASNRKYEQKNVELSTAAMELKHLKMERDLVESNYNQKIEFERIRNQEISRQIESLKSQINFRKSQTESEIKTLRSEKQTAEKNLEELEAKHQSTIRQLDDYFKELTITKQAGKSSEGAFERLTKQIDGLRKENNILHDSENQSQRTISQLNQKILTQEEYSHREALRIREDYEKRIAGLQREIESKKNAVEQKQREVREYVLKISTHNTDSSTVSTVRQELQGTINLLERSLDDFRRENDKKQIQLDNLGQKLEEKIRQNSALALELRQASMEKQMIEENLKHKIEYLGEKNTDFQREASDLKAQIYSQRQAADKEKQELTNNYTKLERTLAEIENRYRALEGQLQKSRNQQIALEESKKSLLSMYQKQEEQLKRIYAEEREIQGGVKKTREQNKYLKQIVQLLDEDYVQDEEDAYNEVKILIKISEEISDLVDRNKYLENQINIFQGEQSDEEWYSSLEILVESILHFLNDNRLIGHRNATKFVYNAEFRGQNLHDYREKYFLYLENFIKELFKNVMTELTENTQLYERTLGDLKTFIEEYYTTGNRSYLDSVRKSLRKLEF